MRDSWLWVVLLLPLALAIASIMPVIRRRLKRQVRYRRRKAMPVLAGAVPVEASAEAAPGRRKPEWVRKEVLRLKAIIGDISTRKLAEAFNRLQGERETVGKTFIGDLIKAHEYQIACLQREFRTRPPKPCRINAIWALDFTFQTDATGNTSVVLGLIDHGSRVLLRLKRLTNRTAWTVLGHLCLAIGEFGKPRALRMDNEAVFRSGILRLALRLLGIRRQFTQPHCPWQNGRIERLFGTLKRLLRQTVLADAAALDLALVEFRLFYNHVRTHMHLDGRTPAEVWQAGSTRMPLKPVRDEPKLVSALGGLLVGYYLRR